MEQFKGPKFGVQGMRKYLGVPERPLLNNMIKPCTGITPDEGAKLFYEAAGGGADWIKDDELIAASPKFSPLEARTKAYMAAAKKADKEKGEKTMYTVNITDETNRLLDNAHRALAAGANGLMVDVFGTGYSGLRMLADDPDIQVPICAHTCYGGAQTVSPFQGISTEVAQKLIRLCGADITLNVAPSAKFNALNEKFIRTFQVTQLAHVRHQADHEHDWRGRDARHGAFPDRATGLRLLYWSGRRNPFATSWDRRRERSRSVRRSRP